MTRKEQANVDFVRALQRNTKDLPCHTCPDEQIVICYDPVTTPRMYKGFGDRETIGCENFYLYINQKNATNYQGVKRAAREVKNG